MTEPQEKRRPLKRFGQHFLTSPAVAQRIVDAAGIAKDDAVLEIGPGRGILTELLAERAGRLVAVELDRHLARELALRYHGRPGVRIVQADFLEIETWDLGLPSGAVVVSNLPYNAAVPIIEKLLAASIFSRLVLMVQREVAWRMAASPGSKEYGSLSVYLQAQARVEKLFDVRPGSFLPPPQVISTVVRLSPRDRPLVSKGEAAEFYNFVRRCFGYRRKKMSAVLKRWWGRDKYFLEEVGRAAGIDFEKRAEDLSLDEFLKLFHEHKKAEGDDRGLAKSHLGLGHTLGHDLRNVDDI